MSMLHHPFSGSPVATTETPAPQRPRPSTMGGVQFLLRFPRASRTGEALNVMDGPMLVLRSRVFESKAGFEHDLGSA